MGNLEKGHFSKVHILKLKEKINKVIINLLFPYYLQMVIMKL